MDPGLLGGPLFFLSLFAVMFLVILPVAAMLLGVGLLTSPASFIKSSESGRRHYLTLLSLVALSAGIYATAFSQPTVIKLLWGSVPALVLAVLLADRLVEQFRNLAAGRRALAILFAFMLLMIAMVPIYKFQKIYRGDESELQGAESARSSDYPLIDLINRESGPEDYYFGYKWASIFYYRLNARPATPYTLFIENFLTPDQMRDLFEHLERNRPKFMTFSSERDMLWLVSQNKDFVDLLNKHYFLRGRFGQWSVYQRKD
jgi:hypothetical protein